MKLTTTSLTSNVNNSKNTYPLPQNISMLDHPIDISISTFASSLYHSLWDARVRAYWFTHVYSLQYLSYPDTEVWIWAYIYRERGKR